MTTAALPEKRRGYVRVVAVRGAQFFVHWSLPTAVLLLWGAASMDSDFNKGAFLTSGYVFLIALHEVSHVVVGWLLGLRVFAIYVSGSGGLCLIERATRVWRSVLVYAAGLLAQLALFLLTLCYVARFGQPASLLGQCVVLCFTVVNAAMFLWNAIPLTLSEGLATDGYVLWKLYLHARHGHPHPHPVPLGPDEAPVFPPETALLSVPGLVPTGFTTGIEILNDRTTPMEFVVATLMRHLQVDQLSAMELMLRIHNNGGALVPVPCGVKAEQLAAAITCDARGHGHPLTCRAVTAQD